MLRALYFKRLKVFPTASVVHRQSVRLVNHCKLFLVGSSPLRLNLFFPGNSLLQASNYMTIANTLAYKCFNNTFSTFQSVIYANTTLEHPPFHRFSCRVFFNRLRKRRRLHNSISIFWQIEVCSTSENTNNCLIIIAWRNETNAKTIINSEDLCYYLSRIVKDNGKY